MTKKLNPLEDPPTASSSDDDEVETSAGEGEEEEEEEDASSSEEDEPIKDLIKIPSSAAPSTAAPAKSTSGAKKGSDSDSGSETETDSDSETTNPPNSGSGKTVSVSAVSAADPPSSTTIALPAAKSGTKRPASEGTSSREVKRAKKVVTSGGEDEIVKKPAFQRLWSEEDEITVLQGIIDFKADTGKSLYDDSNGFYDFVKNSISFEVSKNQFMDKIRSLKKKYMGKEVKNGVEPSFLKAHDKKAFGLSKKIWGPDGMALESNVKSNGVTKKSQSKSKKLASVKQELSFVASPNGKSVEDDDKVLIQGGESDWFENSFVVRSIASFGVDEYAVRQRWSLLPAETKKVLEEKLKVLQAKEFEFVMEKTGFLHEVTSMIVEASKNKSQ